MYPFIDPSDFTFLRQSNLMGGGGYGGSYPDDYSGDMGVTDPSQMNMAPPTPPPNVPSIDYTPGIQAPRPPERNIMDVVNQLYTPSNDAMDAYNNLLNQYPHEQRPSLGRTIIASMMAGSNPKGAQEVMDDPYKKALAEWTQQVTPRYNAAQQETARNSNERQLAFGTAQNIVNQERYDKQAQTAQEKNDIARIRALAYQYKVEHPDWKITAPKGGFITAYNPANPKETEVLKDEFGKPVATGTSTDADLADINNRASQKRVETQVAGSTQNAKINRTQLYQEVGEDGKVHTYEWTPNPNSETGGIKRDITGTMGTGKLEKPGTAPPTKPNQLPNEANVQKLVNTRMAQLYSTTAAGRYWIKPPATGQGDWKLDIPTGLTSDKDRAVWAELNKRIYNGIEQLRGASMNGPININTPNGGQRPLQTAPPAPQGWKYVPKAGGGWTAVRDQ